jgi:hypothetical protein
VSFNLKRIILIISLFVLNFQAKAQIMNYYWSTNFNSVSSLLGGAVVAGEGDNTSIYYNPATITESEKGNNFSLTSSLFTYYIYNYKNVLGDGINMYTDYFIAQPPFISYSYKPKRHPELSISAVLLTRAKEDIILTWAGSQNYNVLHNLPGEEKYNALFAYRSYYIDSWGGIAVAHQVTSAFSYGVSFFISGASLKYHYNYSTSAYSNNDTLNPEIYPQVQRIAQNDYEEYIKFTDYRVLFKIGFLYKTGSWRFGLNITTPTMYVFSLGKFAVRSELVSNISLTSGEILPDYEIFSGQEDDQLKTNFKLPLSISVGFIKNFENKNKKLYFSAEYFNRIKPYKMVDAEIDDGITDKDTYNLLENKDWLSFAFATRSFANVVIGYSWRLRKNREFLNSFRTDLSNIQNADLGNYSDYNTIKTLTINRYHYSAGLKFNIKKSNFIAGGELSFAYKKNMKQIINFTDPVEINEGDGTVLQGPLKNNMNVVYWGISVYIGATLNFMKNE